MGTIDRDLYSRLEGLEDMLQSSADVMNLLTSSNESFSELGTATTITAELDRRDALWTTALPGEGVELIDAVSDNAVADQLRAHQRTYRNRYGYEVYGEIFVTNRFGGNVAATATTSDYRQDDEGWWQTAARDGLFVGAVEFDESAGILAVEIAVRVEDLNGALLGVAKAVLDIEEMEGLVSRFRETSEHQSTAVFLFDGDGNIFIDDGVDPRAPLSAPPVEWLTTGEGFAYADGEPELLLARASSHGHRELGATPWHAVVQIDAADVLAPAFRLQSTLLLVGLGTLAVAISIAWVTSRRIAAPIERASEITDRLAQGELGVAIESNDTGEVGRLMTAVRTMVDNIRETVSRMLGSSDRLAQLASNLVEVGRELAHSAENQSQASQETSASVEELSTSVRQVAVSSREVATTLEDASATVEEMAQVIQEVAKRTRALAAGVEGTTVTVREMVTSIEAVAANAAQAQEASRQAAVEAHSGSDAVRQTMEGMERIETAMRDIVQVIRNLDESSQRITQITGTIEQIAKQSRLLALNATVQAAHAGEHGRGFATVAEEVGRLAQRSADAVDEIGATLTAVQDQIRRATAASEAGAGSVGDGMERAGQAGEVLRRIATSVDVLSAMMIEVRSATEEQVSATTGMAATFDQMRGLTSEVESATREQAVSSERISRSIESMHTMAVQVSAATSEQSRGTEEIAHTIHEVATIAKRNADVAKEIAGSSETLQTLSTELKRVASFFRPGEGAASSTAEAADEKEETQKRIDPE
jgi:methyl-accepting chemotaxis protein